MKFIVRTFVRGLAIILPVVITIELLRWLLLTVENWLAPVLQNLAPESWYFPGLALLSFILICIGVGFSAQSRGMRWLWQLPGRLLMKIPGARQIYSLVTDLFDVMGGKNFADESVVIVQLPGTEVELIGIITKKSGIRDDQMSALLAAEQVAVFLPMAYNMGGYMVIVPRSCTRNIDLQPAEALQLVLSGGLGASRAPGMQSPPDSTATNNRQQQGN